MSASLREVQDLADQILELLGVRIRNGELVIRYGDALVQKLETRTVSARLRAPRRPSSPPINPRTQRLLER